MSEAAAPPVTPRQRVLTALAHRQLQLIANQVENWRMDAQLVDYSIEMLG